MRNSLVYNHQDNIDSDSVVCQYFKNESKRDICIKGSRINKQRFRLSSNEDQSSSESFAKTTRFTFKRNKTRNSITNDLNQVENKPDEKESKLEENGSLPRSPSK